MTITFFHPHKALLPEIQAYIHFFSKYGIDTQVERPENAYGLRTDVEWHFMGYHTNRKKGAVVIHEYASASVPPFSQFKDRIKKWINCKPDYRLFNNDYVLQQFHFHDQVPYGIRNYGIRTMAADTVPDIQKKYDFIYVGSVDKSRKPELLLKQFTVGPLKNYCVLVLTSNYDKIAQVMHHAGNIDFKGPVPLEEVYTYIQQARFAINYMPDILPYNEQTSAKFLDYVACGIPVITSDYKWVRNFQEQYGGAYFYLKSDLSNFTWKNVHNFLYERPDLTNWTWERQIRTSGVLEFLQSTFPGITFSN